MVAGPDRTRQRAKNTHSSAIAPQRTRDAPIRTDNRTQPGHLSSRSLATAIKCAWWSDGFFHRRVVLPTAKSFLFIDGTTHRQAMLARMQGDVTVYHSCDTA